MKEEPKTLENEKLLDEYSSPSDRIEQLTKHLNAMLENRDYWYNLAVRKKNTFLCWLGFHTYDRWIDTESSYYDGKQKREAICCGRKQARKYSAYDLFK